VFLLPTAPSRGLPFGFRCFFLFLAFWLGFNPLRSISSHLQYVDRRANVIRSRYDHVINKKFCAFRETQVTESLATLRFVWKVIVITKNPMLDFILRKNSCSVVLARDHGLSTGFGKTILNYSSEKIWTSMPTQYADLYLSAFFELLVLLRVQGFEAGLKYAVKPSYANIFKPRYLLGWCHSRGAMFKKHGPNIKTLRRRFSSANLRRIEPRDGQVRTPALSNFAKRHLRIANLAVGRNNHLITISHNNNSRLRPDANSRKNKKKQKQNRSRIKWIRTRYVGGISGGVTDLNSGETRINVDTLDLDVSEDGKVWFHFFGFDCIEELETYKGLLPQIEPTPQAILLTSKRVP